MDRKPLQDVQTRQVMEEKSAGVPAGVFQRSCIDGRFQLSEFFEAAARLGSIPPTEQTNDRLIQFIGC